MSELPEIGRLYRRRSDRPMMDYRFAMRDLERLRDALHECARIAGGEGTVPDYQLPQWAVDCVSQMRNDLDRLGPGQP